MLLVSQPQSTVLPNPCKLEIERVPVRYRGWLISTQLIDSQLWVRWQHPKESFPRYGCPVTEDGLAATIEQAQSLIDLTIKLEERAPFEW